MSSEAKLELLTIGHSNLSIGSFIELLREHAVTAVVDVRSQPFSRFNPDFNRERFAALLKEHGIVYAFLGDELGGRSKDPSSYLNGRIQYQKLAQTASFKAGLRRLVNGARTHRLALVCAEKEPLACHRTLLIGRALVALGVDVEHIHEDGSLESQADAMQRLLILLGMPPFDLFRNEEETIAAAIAKQAERIAYVDENMR